MDALKTMIAETLDENSEDMTAFEFLDAFTYRLRQEKEVDELFGDCKGYLPEDESEIVWDNSLNHAQKVAKLKTVRASKRGSNIMPFPAPQSL